MDIEKPNCIGCHHMHPDNGNCTAVGGFCTAVPAAHCPLIPELRADLARVTAERDAAVEAVKNMAEYIVCAGRVDYYLCDEISQEHHLKYQPKNDGNYDNEPCYKCIADWFLQGHKWQENC